MFNLGLPAGEGADPLALPRFSTPSRRGNPIRYAALLLPPAIIPATSRRVCLLQERAYRTAVAMQSSGYFYPPQVRNP